MQDPWRDHNFIDKVQIEVSLVYSNYQEPVSIPVKGRPSKHWRTIDSESRRSLLID